MRKNLGNVIYTTKTDKNGEYEFKNLKPEIYRILFIYNSEEFELTEYRKTDQEEINSNAISTSSGKAITEEIIITDKNVKNINLGLKEIKKFDMKLNKTISKIIVQNEEETKTYNFNNAELAKVEVNSKKINGTSILIEYNIEVINEGNIAGTIEKIIDYIPREMSFTSDINKDWLQDSDGNLIYTGLKAENIEPGESRETQLILRKNLTEDNIGVINNRAELLEVSNNDNIIDTDSFPGNKNELEDDISSADVIIGVATGEKIVYLVVFLLSFIFIGIGIYLIKKLVIRR